MRRSIIAMIALAATLASALASACVETDALEGSLAIPQCDPKMAGKTCVPGGRAVFAAMKAHDVPAVFTIALQTSPWRMYDGDGRIMSVEELATMIRAQRPPTDKRVQLVGSWTAARPDGIGKTLSQRMSTALGGLPVDGFDGFLWASPTGALRTTRQAVSIWKAGPYQVDPGADILVPLVSGAMAQFEDDFARDGTVAGIVEAGIGQDVFMLCPESALAAFERAANMGSAIGAYNAGSMHLEAGRQSEAVKWLEQASTLGEAKAAAALAKARAKPVGRSSP